MEFLYKWITKPYIQWNFIDGLVSSFEILLILTIGMYLYFMLINRK